MSDYSSISFKNNGKLKLLIIVGTRPEIIRLAAVINKTRKYFDVILAHTGQNYDYNLNGVFFHDLQLADPEVYMNAVGADLGETMGNIISESYKLMAAIQPDARAGAGRHKQLPVRHRCEAAAHPHLPHGGRQPLQGRVPARGDEPPHRGHHLRCEHGLLRACPPLSGRHRPAEGAHLRDRFPDGRGAAPESGQNRGI